MRINRCLCGILAFGLLAAAYGQQPTATIAGYGYDGSNWVPLNTDNTDFTLNSSPAPYALYGWNSSLQEWAPVDPTGGGGGMVYPGAGVANSTGSAWGTSYSVNGSGAGLVSGPSTSTSGDAAIFTGTAGQLTDAGGVPALLNAANTFADAQTFSGGYTVTAAQTASFPGYNSWTIYGLNSNPGGIVFSSPNHLSNAGWIHDNVTGAVGFGVLSSEGAGYWWASSPTAAGDTALCRSSAGTVEIASGSSCNSKGTLAAAAFQSGGTVATISGCGTPTATGGATIFSFTAGATSCNPVITTGLTASNGWHCTADDETTDITFRQTAHTTTTATLTASGSATTSDVIDVTCGAW